MKYLTPVLLIVLCILGLWIVVRGTHDYTKSRVPKVHQYDYIIEVDGTDSISIYTLYDYQHNEIGKFSSENTKMLDEYIIEDNL